MTTTEFKNVVSQFGEHLYHKMPAEMKTMDISEYTGRPGGVRITLKAASEMEGLPLIWERTVRIPEEKLPSGLGELVDGLLDLAHYKSSLSVVEAYGFPFTYSTMTYEVENHWFIDFGGGVKIPAVRHRIAESRTSRILQHLGTPWPEWRVSPAYPDKIRGTFGWNARWAEAHAERAARAAYKMMAASWGRLDTNCKKGAVQIPGRGFEPTQDHDRQDWPQSEL